MTGRAVLATKRSADVWSGAFLALLGLVTTIASRDIDEGAGGHLHPQSFPVLVGVLLLAGGALLALHALVTRRGEDQEIAWPDRKGWRLWLVALGALVLYVALAPVLGFLVSSGLFVAGLVWFLGRYHPLVAAACGLGVALFLWAAFVWLLDLALPSGLLV